jgi:GNAT superfamily N-acetyltransferase
MVRRAVLSDAPRMAELSGQLGYPATAAQVEQRFRQLDREARHAVFVAELAGGKDAPVVIGFLHVEESHLILHDAVAEISGLVIADGYRGRGAGRLLMEQAERWARERGCQAVVLRSNVVRAGAHAFYEKLGYEAIKTQKVFRKSL